MDLTSGYPFWPIKNGLIRVYPPLDHDATCDVVVLGAGITGALVAHSLVEAGIDTIVVDKRETGWGSTAASTALVQYEIDVTLDELTKKLGPDHAVRAYLACRDAVHTLEQLASRLPVDVGLRPKKSLHLASRRRDKKTLLTELALRQAIGLRVEWLDERDLARQFGFRRPAALLSHDAAQVDAYALTHALLSDASSRGLRVFDRTLVEKIDASTSGVVLRVTGGNVLRAKRLVFASGFETRDYLKKKVARLVSTFAVASEPMPQIDAWGQDRCMIWEHARPYLYLRTTDDGRVLVGGEDEDFRNPDQRDRMLPRKARRLAERFGELFPDVPFRIAFAWAGTFGETADGLAYVGAHPDWPSSYFALGYGGNGITFSALAAEIIRDAILGRPNENARLFRFDR